MVDRSLNQVREDWDKSIGDARKAVQERQEFAEAFKNLAERIESVEPTSPIAGNAQRYVLNYCEERRQQALEGAAYSHKEVIRLQTGRP